MWRFWLYHKVAKNSFEKRYFRKGLLAIMLLLALSGCGETEQTQSKPANVSKEDVKKEAKTKLQELKTAGDEAWEAVKSDAEKAWAEVKTEYHDAASKFK